MLSQIIKQGAITLKRIKVPLYLSKYSRKDYTVHQHLLMLAVKELEMKSYREVIDLLYDMDKVCEELKIEKLPHFTTLNKFLKRIPKYWLTFLLKKMVYLFTSKLDISGDATGFKLNKASFSYTQKIGRKTEIRETIKLISALECNTMLIANAIVVNGRRHESPYFIPLMENIENVSSCCWDKGVDAEKNQQFLAENKITSFVDVRDNPKRGHYRKKVYRNKFKEEWKRIYRIMRNKVESYHFVIKGYGECISGRSFEMQEKKLFLRVFSYNIKIIGEGIGDNFCLVIFGFMIAENSKEIRTFANFFIGKNR